MVEIRVQLDEKKWPRHNARLPPVSGRAAYPLLVTILMLFVALMIIVFHVGQQYQASLKTQSEQARKARLSYTNVCRRFLPANCTKKCIHGGANFTKLSCIRDNGYFVERQNFFRGPPVLCHSPEKVANLSDLVQSIASFKELDQAAGSQGAEQLLRSELIKHIVCLLKRSVWISANLETVYNRIGGGGCATTARQLLDGLEFLLSAIPKRDKDGPPDEKVVAAVRSLIGSIPIAAECCQLLDRNRVDQFVEELKILKAMEDVEIYHLHPQTNTSEQQP